MDPQLNSVASSYVRTLLCCLLCTVAVVHLNRPTYPVKQLKQILKNETPFVGFLYTVVQNAKIEVFYLLLT